MTERVAAQLSAAGIQVLIEGRYCMFTRDGFVAVVERRSDGFGTIGSAGLMTEHGLAYLVWREGEALFVNRIHRQSAEPGQVESMRRFSADLNAALR